MNIKMLSSTALALALVLASTGCRHRPVGVTKIPNDQNGQVGGLGPGNTMGGETGGINSGGAIPPVAYNPDNFTHDESTLAAYSVHFAFDSAVIRDSEQANLQAVAQQLQANPNDQLEVDGNCDERGTDEYNRSLGERRALAAREALSHLGIDPSKVHEISYGKDKPVDPGHDEAAWSKNRRDDFVLLIPKTNT